MARASTRTQPCTRTDAKTRLAQAEKYLELATIAQTEGEVSKAAATVAVGNAVLAAIAAADAACCAALGRRARGQDHREARSVLADVQPGGDAAAAALGKLLSLKDTAHYGFVSVSGQNVKTALRKAQELLEFARLIVER
jgi:hypothetical protein